MAEVRYCFGRGVHEIAHTTFNRYLLRSLSEEGKSAIKNSSLSAGLLTGYSKNCERHEAANAAHRVTHGASRLLSYASVTPVPGAFNDVLEEGSIAKYNVHHGLTAYSLCKNARGRIAGINVPRFRRNVKYRRTFCTFSPHNQGVCVGHRPCVLIRKYSSRSAQDEPLHKTKTGYYDILEVAPSATQAQIKTAYYKQSFVYHPDRNAGSEEATVRFSEISEAYTVLGNSALRRKYDRGLLSPADLVATGKPSSRGSGAGSSAKQQPETRRSVVGTDTRGGVFDFDQFFKSHYSEQLQRQRDIRVRREQMLRERQEKLSEKKMEKMMEVCVGLLLLMAAGIVVTLKRGRS